MTAVPALETVACLCGSKQQGTAIEARDPLEGTAWIYRRCLDCELERLSPRPVIGEMGRYYPTEYTPYSDPAPLQTNRTDRIKRMVYETYFAPPAERSDTVRHYRLLLAAILLPFRQHSVLSFVPPDLSRHVFEFGAGTGADLIEFRNAGWEVSGCEPSAAAAAAAAANGITLVVCNAEEADIPANLACVYMNNVFEHLHDPKAVLAKAHEALLPGGLVVVIVPNHASWAARMFGSFWPGYDPPRHIWGYTPRAIRAVFTRAGFAGVSVAHKYPLSTYCWNAGLSGRGTGTNLRRGIARLFGRGVLLGGLAASVLGGGDYIRVIARKP